MGTLGETSGTTWLRVADVADLLGVSANTVRRWTDAGRLAAHRSPGGHRRYRADDIAAVLPETRTDGGVAQPGDFAELRRQTQNMRLAMRAAHEIAALLADRPREVPELVARTLCRLTGAARCDVYERREDAFVLSLTVEDDRVDDSRAGSTQAISDWTPIPGALDEITVTTLRADDGALGARGRLALQRRGCRALLWAPLVSGGRLIGALELSDASARDLAPHAELVDGLAHLCAEAIAVSDVYRGLERRDKAISELTALSQEVAQTHDVRRFVERFAQRMMTALNADCVDVFRVSGGIIRGLVDLRRDGFDATASDTALDTSKYPSMERVLLDYTPLAVNSLDDPVLGPGEADLYREWGYASSLTMPLVAGGTLVGLLDVYDDAERDWTLEIDFLTSVTQLVAGVFDNAALLDEAEKRSVVQQELAQLAAAVGAGGSREAIAVEAARRLRAFVDCADCDIWWLSEGYQRCLASYDADGVDVAVSSRTMDLPNHPSTGEALERREILVLSSPDDPRLTAHERETWARYDFRSELMLPLVAGDETVGVIDIYDTRERDFNDVWSFLVSAGRTIADALRNADLMASLRRNNDALRELVELGDLMAEAGSLETLARVVAERLRDILKAEDCDIWRVTNGRLQCLASFDSRGWDEEEVGSVRELSAYNATIASLAREEPMVIGDLEHADLAEEELEAYRRWSYRSFVSVPLVVEGRPIGLVDIFDTRERDFTSQLDIIRNIGRQLSGAFERAMLVDRLESSNRDLRLLADSGLEFGASLEMDALLHTVAERILEVSGADMCDVYRLDGDEVEILVSLGGDWNEDPVGNRYPLTDYGIFIEAAERRQPVLSLDILEDPDMTQMERVEAEKWGYRAALDIALVSQGDVIGFVSLYNRGSRPFARQDVIVGLANIAGQALANAVLYQELADNMRRASLLSESALELAGSLDLRDTLLVTARRLCDSCCVHECEITVIEGDVLRTIMRVADGEVEEQRIGQTLPLADAAVSREVIETKRPAFVGSLRDPRLTPAVLAVNEGVRERCWAVLPLIVKDRVIGTVELVETGVERDFAQTELDTAMTICHAAAMAIDNAGLFERAQTAAQETQLLNVMAQRTAATLDLEEVVDAAVDELRRLLLFENHNLLLLRDGVIDRVISPRPESQSLVGVTVEQMGHDFVERITSATVSLLRLPDDIPLSQDHPSMSGLRSAALIALHSETDLLGVLILSTSVADAFTDVDTGLLERVGTQLALAIKNARLYEEIKLMHLGNLKALSSALNAKDYYTLGHAARVAAYTVMLGRQLGWDDDVLESLEEAAYLHDIGKISISDRVLLKPGRLNEQEWEQMRQHPAFSADIIRPLFPDPLVQAVRHHHERYNGSGYPDGLVAEQIPLFARAMAVVDAYDAMSCRRPYKAALTYSECLAELQRCRGTQFDPQMVDAFLTVLGDLEGMRSRAEAVAAAAAERVPGEIHLALRNREDEESSEYRQIATVLREVRDTNPPTRFITTHMRIDKRYVIGVDPEESESQHSHFGDEIFADDELEKVLAGAKAEVNTLFADEFGVWVTGLAPIRAANGDIVAAVAADLPALSASETETVRGGDQHQTFAAMLQTAAVRLSRAEIDAITDALTGLYNHRYLHERLDEELHRANETGNPLSVLFCDLDHFKEYNDANGHSAGDNVLREVAHLLEQSVRNIDVAGRYGGEEFVVLLVETGHNAALTVAQRIRERIAGAGFTADGTPLTVSIGVASYPEDADRGEELLDKADWAMYLAKRRGRNRVAAFADA